MSGFSITDFNSKFSGIVSTANFLVNFTTPNCLLNTDQGAKMSDLTFLCHTATHPGIGVATQRINRFGYAGASYLVPYASVLEDAVMFDFYIRASDVLPVQVFNYWIQQIVGVPNDRTLLGLNAGKVLMPGQVAYRDSYTSKVEIVSYDYESNQLIRTTLTGAFPTRISELQTSWVEGDIAKVQITMAYAGISVRAEVVADGEQPVGSSVRGSTDPYSEEYASAKRTKQDKNQALASSLDKLLGLNSTFDAKQFFNSSVSDQLNRLYNTGSVPGNIQSQGIPT
jgi:hypothetical protein